jgi:hypothetical protein
LIEVLSIFFIPALALLRLFDVSGFLLQSSLRSAFATQQGKEFTASLLQIASVYCWFLVGVICRKRLEEEKLTDNETIQIYLYLLLHHQVMEKRNAPQRVKDRSNPAGDPVAGAPAAGRGRGPTAAQQAVQPNVPTTSQIAEHEVNPPGIEQPVPTLPPLIRIEEN